MSMDPKVDANRDPSGPAAYGGARWRPREAAHREELGTHWARCGVDSEWATLRAVLMHRPGAELRHSADPDAVLMLEPLDAVQAGVQHDAVASAYKLAGVKVHYVEPAKEPPPNQMFCADLLLGTPEGIIIGRQASAVRAGEERWAARRLGELGIPIVKTVGGRGCFEGADAQWIAPDTVLISRGLRTNAEGAQQVATALREMGVEPIVVDAVPGTMHLMGQLRLVDAGRAVIWPGGLSAEVEALLQERGCELLRLPDETELRQGLALNFVTLAPGQILMPAGNPRSQAFLEAEGITCQVTAMDELAKAAGGIGCLTGVLWRAPAEASSETEAASGVPGGRGGLSTAPLRLSGRE